MTIREKYITMLYISTLGRMPDKAGFQYWVDSGLTIPQIAKSFFEQKETKELYPPNYSIEQFVSAVYENLFDREPDEAGKKYWIDELKSGNIKRDQFIISVIYGASGEDREILEKKIQAPFLDSPEDIKSIESRSELNTSLSKYYDKIEKVSNINKKVDTEALEKTPIEAKALISKYKWEKNVLTYTFNETIPHEYYKAGSQYTTGWRPFTEEEKDKVRDIFKSIEKSVNLTFKEVPVNGDIRFNHVDMPSTKDGFTKYPYANNTLGGDIWISNSVPFRGDEPGTGRYMTYVHEIGHALGLKHPFEGTPKLSPILDDSNHTIMTYTYKGDEILKLNNSVSDVIHDYSFYRVALPDTYLAYDIEALQSMYGARIYGSNDDNTIYNLSNLYTEHTHKVIWDTGGVDTIDLSTTQYPNYIDMRGGKYSSVDVHFLHTQMQEAIQHFIDNGIPLKAALDWGNRVYQESNHKDRIYTGENNLSIVKGTIIENIVTGSGNDVVIDNKYNNNIKTGAGDDKVFIRGGGYDQIDGGEGSDKVYFEFPMYQAKVEKLSDGEYIVDASEYHNMVILLKDVELIGFSDTHIDLS